MTRVISFEYLNRQLVWHEISELLLLLLPLLQAAKLRYVGMCVRACLYVCVCVSCVFVRVCTCVCVSCHCSCLFWLVSDQQL